MKINPDKYYIVRGDRSGVFFGKINAQEGQEVEMTDVRRLWYWDGAASISQLALEGTTMPQNCKFTVSLAQLVLLDAIEIIECTDDAISNIKAVKVWRQ